MSVVRHLDLVVLALALPVFLLAGWPLLGWAAACVAWVVQRAIAARTNAKAAASDDPKHVAGWVTGSMIGRGWLVAITIFGAGMVDDDAGLAAAVLFLLVFTVSFAVSMFLRPFSQQPTEQPSS
jgi:hypothetical protein